MLDFGLAKVTSEGQTDSNLTREGQMVGTPDFIAPEQIRDAKSADIRADIYSLGCTLYYLLTGGPPFRGEHLWDIYQAHFSMDAVPLNLVRPEIPVELAAMVAKMMAKEPGRRFQMPGEIARALTPFFKAPSTQSPGPSVGMPRVEPRVPPAQPSSAVPAPRRPQNLPVAPAPAVRRLPKSGADLVAWESLIEIKEDEALLDPENPKSAEPRPALTDAAVGRRPWKLGTQMVVASLFGLVLLGIIIKVINKNGEVTIVARDDEPFKYEQDGLRIEHDPSKRIAPEGGGKLVPTLPRPARTPGSDTNVANTGKNKAERDPWESGKPESITKEPPQARSSLKTPTSLTGTAPVRASGPDFLQRGTVWEGESGRDEEGKPAVKRSVTFTVLERDGERFKARWEGPVAKFEIRGKCANGKIGWFGRDVVSEKGRVAHDFTGTIQGEQISLHFQGVNPTSGKPVSGTGSLRLKK